MTTWGDTEDFKHYLPRIFELVATTNFIVDTSVVFGKLDYGKWESWPDNEKDTIVQFLYAWWADLVKYKSEFDNEAFGVIYDLTGDIDQMLGRWTITFNDNSFLNYVDFIYNFYNDLTGRRKSFAEFDDTSVKKLMEWIKKNSGLLEKGFFHYADKDNELAEKISVTQFMLEANTH